MEQNRVKSAWEIAMERAERLGTLSPEELRQQEEEEHRPIGHGLAVRYLSGLPLRDVETQMSKYRGTAAEAVRRGFLQELVAAIGFEDAEKARLAIQGVHHFFATERVNSISERIIGLLAEYQEDKKQSSLRVERELDALATTLLEERGIAGSAIRPNPRRSGPWSIQAPDSDTQADFENRLSTLLKDLSQSVS